MFDVHHHNGLFLRHHNSIPHVAFFLPFLYLTRKERDKSYLMAVNWEDSVVFRLTNVNDIEECETEYISELDVRAAITSKASVLLSFDEIIQVDRILDTRQKYARLRVVGRSGNVAMLSDLDEHHVFYLLRPDSFL
jgi:hypothetical protein